ncbi:hypothetical protein LP420_27520 [Massilia sp. B-10]|nr:hypothetical protein LP420_27520 [Massilia sp. B-10]
MMNSVSPLSHPQNPKRFTDVREGGLGGAADAAVANAKQHAPEHAKALKQGAEKIKSKTNEDYDKFLRSPISN